MEWITESSESDTRTSYPINRVVWEGATTACGSVVIADSSAFGRMLFLDGELQSAAADEHIYHEALVHPVMTMSPLHARVLVIGGGEGATVREVLRWKPRQVDWVDIDGELVERCRMHLAWAPAVYSDPTVRFHPHDIREVLPRLGTYDVIILDLPDPDGDTGYLYSDAFMRDIHAHLTIDGSIATHCGPVRPFGDIGAGFQRLRPCTLGPGDARPHFRKFYSQMIPSFQSEWGFLIWTGMNRQRALPSGLRVADEDQLERWFTPSKLWKAVLVK
jgi:spermidine synthase